LNERLEQMAKNIEDLANMIAILQARIPEHSQTAPENREARNSQTDKRQEEEVHKSSLVEETEERLGHQEPTPGDLPPQTNAERAMHGMIT
jgi:chromosome segregation ATPase